MSIETAITEEGGSPPGGIPVRVRRALISVSDKAGVVDFARGLRELGIEILSTGRHRGGDPRGRASRSPTSPSSPARRRSSTAG